MATVIIVTDSVIQVGTAREANSGWLAKFKASFNIEVDLTSVLWYCFVHENQYVQSCV